MYNETPFHYRHTSSFIKVATKLQMVFKKLITVCLRVTTKQPTAVKSKQRASADSWIEVRSSGSRR